MNAAHWHLLTNHAPIIGTIIALLILIAGFFLKNKTVKQTALFVFMFSTLSAIVAFQSGHGAESMARQFPDTTRHMIHEHEELGELFTFLLVPLGILSLVIFMLERKQKAIVKILYIVLMIGGIGVSIIAQKAGTSGGEIRHTEIRGEEYAVSQDDLPEIMHE